MSIDRAVFAFAGTFILISLALAHWHSVNLLTVAIPLFGAFAGIRFAVYLLRLAIPAGAGVEAFERLVVAVIWGVLALPFAIAGRLAFLWLMVLGLANLAVTLYFEAFRGFSEDADLIKFARFPAGGYECDAGMRYARDSCRAKPCLAPARTAG